jgi:hypothetical protein
VTVAELADRPVAQRIAAVVATTLFLIGIAVAAGRSGDDLAADEARLTTEGRVTVVRAGGDATDVSGTEILRRGDVVEAVDGTLVIELPDGSQLEGRSPITDGARATRLRLGLQGPQLLEGSLLVVAKTPVTVEAAGTTMTIDPPGDDDAVARVDRSLAVVTDAFRGNVTVDSAGVKRVIPPLRSMEVSVFGRPPTRPRPLTWDEADPWDQRFLGDAIALSRRLDRLSQAYTQSLAPGEGVTAGFYQLVVPALSGEPGFTQDLITAQRPPGETLVGATITMLGNGGTFRERWNEVFRFRDDGAAWGLVALDRGVEGEPVAAGIERALTATPFEFAQSPIAPPPITVLPSGPTSPDEPVTTTTTTTSPPPPTSPATSTTEPDAPLVENPVPETGVPLLDTLLEPVEDLLGGLLGPRGPVDDLLEP